MRFFDLDWFLVPPLYGNCKRREKGSEVDGFMLASGS